MAQKLKEFTIVVFGRTTKRRDQRAEKVVDHIARGLRRRPGYTTPVPIQSKGNRLLMWIMRGVTPVRLSVAMEANDAPELEDWIEDLGSSVQMEELPELEPQDDFVPRAPSASLA